ncbi:MAG: tRNA (adenosine(37)-N6)-dimethylallyltransferase MiaA [Cyanobacteria bacterium P01_A01_bin.84]
MSKLITICGATATGKSGLALNLAKRLNSVILSADSRQVYREFDIGTAKPSLQEQSIVPHYLINICNPTDTLTVADYQQQAQKIISSPALWVSSSPLFLVGGTGLYIKSITKGMKIPRVAPQAELRSQFSSLSQTELYTMLRQVDEAATKKIHPNDSVRTIRALEVYYVTGQPISAQQGENPPKYPILEIGLDCDPNHLTQRIRQRTDQMISDGLVEEVENICDKYGKDLSLLSTLGYQEVKDYLIGKTSLEEAKELIVLHTKQFAKRQRTWFRADSQIKWFDIQNPNVLECIWQCIQQFTGDCDRMVL